MPKYTGKYMGTLSATWPLRNTLDYWRVWRTLGGIQRRDYGKMVFVHDNVVQVENETQRNARLANGN